MWILILMLLFVPLQAFATERTCHDGETMKGYWFYCEKPSPDDAAMETRQALPPPPPHAQMMAMHPDALEKLQQRYLKEAIWQPQPQKVLAYYTVQDVIRRKSLAFTAVSQVVMLENPTMNAYGQYHKTNPGRNKRTQIRQQETRQHLSQYRDHFGLVVFTEPSCGFCTTQKNILSHFGRRHGWRLREIDIKKHPEAAAKFGVQMTPVTIVVSRNHQQWMPIAVGEEALPVLEDNAYRAIRYLNGETRPEQFLNMHYEMGGINDPLAPVQGVSR